MVDEFINNIFLVSDAQYHNKILNVELNNCGIELYNTLYVNISKSIFQGAATAILGSNSAFVSELNSFSGHITAIVVTDGTSNGAIVQDNDFSMYIIIIIFNFATMFDIVYIF